MIQGKLMRAEDTDPVMALLFTGEEPFSELLAAALATIAGSYARAAQAGDQARMRQLEKAWRAAGFVFEEHEGAYRLVGNMAMEPGTYVVLDDLVPEFGIERNGVRRWLRSQGFELCRVRPALHGQWMHALSLEDAKAAIALRAAQGYRVQP